MYSFKKMLNKILPPLIWDLIIFLYRASTGRTYRVKYEQRSIADNIDFKSLYYVSEAKILNLDAAKIRHHGGQAYNDRQHHFLRYYKDGIRSLEAFYSSHQPESVFEKHFIYNHPGRQAILPWRSESSLLSKGEHGLSAGHGHSAFGPVSSQKLKLEAARLDKCLTSIKSQGYLVSKTFPMQDNGFPRGYFLVSSSLDWVFVVVGAKHRVAALVRLGWKNIPVCFEPNFPRCIFESDIEEWPGVKSGYFTQTDATLIFDSYFRDPDMQLWN